jgi:phage gp36-like protein
MTVERWDDDRLDRFGAFIQEGFTQVRQLTESNAKAIQALSDDIAEYKLTTEAKMEQNEARMRQVEEAMLRLDRVAEGLINITVSIDDDRPTMLRKLNSIENKVDRILQQREDRES